MKNPNPISSYTGPLFYVRSGRTPSKFYTVGVNAATGFYVCECLDHQHRHHDCKHIRTVQAGQVAPAKPRPATHPKDWTIRPTSKPPVTTPRQHAPISTETADRLALLEV